MRGQDETIVIGHLGEESLQQLLIGRPGAASDDALPPGNETLDVRERLGLLGNGRHAVETRVATQRDIVEAILSEQINGCLVLHEEMRHRMQLLAEPTTIGTEEERVGLEDERDVEQWDACLLQGPHVIEPKLVFDEESSHEMMPTHPLGGMTGGIGGKISHFVGHRIVLADLIARRREEGQQDFVLRKALFQRLDDRTTLLKLT